MVSAFPPGFELFWALNGKKAHLSRVNSQAIILVLDGRVRDSDIGRFADIKAVGVVATIVVAVRIIDGDILNDEIVRLNADGLHGSVLDGQAGDGRVIEGVSIEELGLGFSAIGTLAVPPARTITVNDGSIIGSHGNTRARDTNKRALPFFISKGRGAVKDHLGAIAQIRQIKGLPSWDLDITQDDGGAVRLAGRGAGCLGECAS